MPSTSEGALRFFGCAVLCGSSSLQALRLLISRGASLDVSDRDGFTPLLAIRVTCYMNRDAQDAVMEILRHSSVQTRRAVDARGRSAVDCISETHRGYGYSLPSIHPLIAELLSSGAPCKRGTPPLSCRSLCRTPCRWPRATRPSWRRGGPRRGAGTRARTWWAWRRTCARDAEKMVAAKRRRVVELEGRFGGSSGTESSGGGGDEGEGGGEEGDADDDGVSGGGDGNGGEGLGATTKARPGVAATWRATSRRAAAAASVRARRMAAAAAGERARGAVARRKEDHDVQGRGQFHLCVNDRDSRQK